MIALEYRMQLLSSLLVSGLPGEPNSAISYPYIPGSQIRGALIGEYLRSRKGNEEDFRKLFFSEDIRYLNAYPEGNAGRRMLPTPRSWFTLKREKGKIFDLSNRESPDRDPHDPKQKLKEVPAEFCSLSSSGEVELCSPMRQINVHTQRDPKMGRATRDEGAVFRYNALAPEQCFVGVILFATADPPSDDLQVVKELLEGGDLWLGRSRSAGYGHVRIDEVRVVEDWQEVDGQRAPRAVSAGEKFTVTLLSDALVRDPITGQFDNDPTSEIAAVLGVDRGDLEIENRFWNTSLVGGFNRKWGLPLPQTVAVAAGSVFVFKTKKEIDEGKFQRLIERGIGERRVEGFGRITVNWRKEQEYTYPSETRDAQGKGTLDPTPPPVLTGESKDIVEKMITRMFRARLDRWLAAEVNRIPIANRPSNSQLSQLRLAARKAMQQGSSLQLIKEHLDDARKRKTAREQFEGAYVDGQRLDRWIYDLLNKPDELLRELHPPEIGGVTLERGKLDELAREYTIRLLDGVLHKATRSSRARTESEGAA